MPFKTEDFKQVSNENSYQSNFKSWGRQSRQGVFLWLISGSLQPLPKQTDLPQQKLLLGYPFFDTFRTLVLGGLGATSLAEPAALRRRELCRNRSIALQGTICKLAAQVYVLDRNETNRGCYLIFRRINIIIRLTLTCKLKVISSIMAKLCDRLAA